MLEFMSIPPPILLHLHPLPVHPLFSLASSLSFDARQGELNRSWLPLFSSLEIICGYPLSSFARELYPSSSLPPLSLFSPLFIIIRFYRASRPETTIKRVGTLCSFDSVGGQFARRRFHPPLPCFPCLHALIEHLVLEFLQLPRPRTQGPPSFPTRY